MYRFFLLNILIFSSSLFSNDDPIAEGKLEKFRAIIHEYEETVKKEPTNTRLSIALGDAYYSLKDYPNAIKLYKMALAIVPDDNALKLSLANAYLADSNKYMSRVLYQEVLNAEPRNVESLAGLGRIKALEYHFKEAEEYYNKGLKITPHNANLQYYMADLQIDLKNYLEAQKMLNKLKLENPKYVWIEKALQRAKDGPILDKIYKLEEKGDYGAAIARYKEEIKNHQGNIEFYLSLAQAYTLSKQSSEALAVLNQAMNIDPASKSLNMGFGEAYMASGNFLEASKYFETILKKDPNDAGALTALGKLYFLLGDNDTAEGYYQLAIKKNPDSSNALSSYALYKISQKKEADALNLYEKIITNDPNAKWARQAIQDILFDSTLSQFQKEPTSQLEVKLETFITENPLRGFYYIKLGNYFIQKKEYQKAIKLYLQGIAADPESLDLKVALANAYLKNGNSEAAKNQFDEVLAAKKNNVEAISGLGKLAELDKRDEDSKKLYKQALTIDPNNLTALNYLADLLIKEKHFDEARVILEKIKKQDSSAKWVDKTITDVKNGSLLAEIKNSIDKKDIQKAELLYQQLLLAEPKNADYYIKAGLFYHHEKKYEKAIEIYLKGIRGAPENAQLYASLGYSYLAKDNLDEALKSFKQALKLDARSPEALSGMGNIWIRRKNFSKAEKYIASALSIAPENDAALSSLGNLRMLEKNYQGAAEIYARLMKAIPNEKWIRLLHENALNGVKLNEIQKLVKDEKYQEAADIYSSLLKKYPANPLYASGLGLMYLRLEDYGKATGVYLEGIKQSPEDNNLLVSLGYSYLLGKKSAEAFATLSKAIEVDAKNAEALAGLGRISAENDCESDAESYFIKALEIQPTNESALNFYGLLLLKEKRFNEAEQIIRRLEFEKPNAVWVKRLLKDAQDGPVTEIAKEFADNEDFESAAWLYTQLVESSPEDPARYEPLGSMYVNLFDYWDGITVYEEGLTIDPDSFYLWRSIAIAYIYLEEFDEAYGILLGILQEHPDDAETWAALGRLESVAGSYECAEQYFQKALELSPENQTVIGFYADFLRLQGYYCSSLAYYNQLMEINDRPKWIRTAFQDMLNKTMPTITLLAGTHEEKQWDPSVHRNSAKYTVNGAGAQVNYPICDGTTLWGRMYDEYFQLRDLLTRQIIYSFDTERGHVGLKTLLSNHWAMDLQLGLTNYSRYRRGTFEAKQGSYFEPGFRFSYKKPLIEASFAFWSDSNIIARDFTRNVSKLVGRYYINGTYQEQIWQRTTVGCDFTAAFYNDYVDNTSATGIGWIQWRPSIYTNNILFRYHLKYGKFAENIPDYYTYKDQWVNYFQVTFENYWRVCFADSFYTSLSLGHGFQNTYTRFAQFIVINPVQNTSLRWDNRQYDILNMKAIYRLDQLQISLILDYYRDTEKYQMSTATFEMTWRF